MIFLLSDNCASTGSQKRKRELSAQRDQKKEKVSRTVEIDGGPAKNDLRRKCSQPNPRYAKNAREAIKVKLLQDLDSDGDVNENDNPGNPDDENNSPDHHEDEDGYWVPVGQQQEENQDGDGLDEDLEEIEQNQAVDLND